MRLTGDRRPSFGPELLNLSGPCMLEYLEPRSLTWETLSTGIVSGSDELRVLNSENHFGADDLKLDA